MQNGSLSKKNIIINVVVILIVGALSYYYLTSSRVITTSSIKSVKIAHILAVTAFFYLSFLLLALLDRGIYKDFTDKMNYGRCLVNVLTGNLGSAVTPYKLGHFPLMLGYQNKVGVKIGESLSALVKCQVVYSLTSIVAYSILVTALAVGGYTIEFYGQTVSLWLCVGLGLAFHLGVFGAICLLAFVKGIRKFSLSLWAKLLYKLKRITDKDEYVALQTEKLEEYKRQITAVITKIHKYIGSLLIYFVEMLVLGSVQYIAYLIISGESFNIATAFGFYVLYLASSYITNLVPVPGGMGTSELLFPVIFGALIPDKIIGGVLILWRVSTYYLPVIINLIVFSVNFLIFKKGKN